MENNQHHRFYDILSDYSNYFYKHKDNDKLEAEYILNENKFILRYDKTTVILLNYLLSNNHCGIILSNQEEIKEDPAAVSQVGEISITIEFILDETVNTGEIEKKKYYLYNVKTQELIDGIVEVCGDTASACFKINADTADISNTKLIFSFYKKDFSDKKEANIKSHDTIILDKATRESKETTVNALINKGDISGFIRGVELFEPTKDDLPDIDSYMETEYKFKATTSGVVNTDYIKWCYAVLTNSEYRGKVKISTVSEQISQTGEEIKFKPKDILSDSSKKKLENKDISAKLYIFAYMKSPAYNTKHGKTHSVCKIKSNVKIEEKLSEHFSLSELVNTSYTEHLEENRQYAMEEDNYLKLKKLCTDILEPIRTHINNGDSAGKKSIIITSGVRCLPLNTKVNGSSTSQHMFCEAVDFVLNAKDEAERRDKLVSLFKDIYNKKVDNLDINNIYQCIIERNKSGSYWLHIGLKTQNGQNQSTSFIVMVQIDNSTKSTKIKYDGSKDFFTKYKF